MKNIYLGVSGPQSYNLVKHLLQEDKISVYEKYNIKFNSDIKNQQPSKKYKSLIEDTTVDLRYKITKDFFDYLFSVNGLDLEKEFDTYFNLINAKENKLYLDKEIPFSSFFIAYINEYYSYNEFNKTSIDNLFIDFLDYYFKNDNQYNVLIDKKDSQNLLNILFNILSNQQPDKKNKTKKLIETVFNIYDVDINQNIADYGHIYEFIVKNELYNLLEKKINTIDLNIFVNNSKVIKSIYNTLIDKNDKKIQNLFSILNLDNKNFELLLNNVCKYVEQTNSYTFIKNIKYLLVNFSNKEKDVVNNNIYEISLKNTNLFLKLYEKEDFLKNKEFYLSNNYINLFDFLYNGFKDIDINNNVSQKINALNIISDNIAKEINLSTLLENEFFSNAYYFIKYMIVKKSGFRTKEKYFPGNFLDNKIYKNIDEIICSMSKLTIEEQDNIVSFLKIDNKILSTINFKNDSDKISTYVEKVLLQKTINTELNTKIYVKKI